ncbi:MAG: DUF975 family protein [Kiritimatiellae bacterium]|nr:DUF975 family protein [Kiritimatiellia bacterium]
MTKRARDYRREAWGALGEGAYWPFVGALAVISLIFVAAILPSILLLLVPLFYLWGFMSWSKSAMSLATMRREMKFELFSSGWGHGWHMCWIQLVKWTYLQLWFLLLFVPGVVKCFSYAMTDYLAVDHPDWTASQCITESRRLMDGNKWRLFCLNLSFFGWWLLVVAASALPCGGFAGMLLSPYVEAANAAFYEDIKYR